VIAIRIFDRSGDGGMWGAPYQMRMMPAGAGGMQPIRLAGAWRYRMGPTRPQPGQYPQRPREPRGPNHPFAPATLYNGLLCPMFPMAIRGVIWYQGESNTGRAFVYRSLFPDLIRQWRKGFDQPDLPFLYVQLANFLREQADPNEASTWAELREAQLMTLRVPHTAMAVTIDAGEADNIHPRDKQTVGRRLALAALAQVYGRDIVYSGPIFREAAFFGPKVRLRFDHVGGGLTTPGHAPLKGFVIAGEDRRFVEANAQIDGNTVVVWSVDVPEPVAVRYGWANNPPCNLYNAEGLPASPFRTDDWPGVTDTWR
jgi:sialate O-acetylesterase